jgi:dCMP deaminase
MMKQKFIDAHMKVAETYSQLSSAKRLQVGCVIVKKDTIIGIGYNGMPTGWTNECEEEVVVAEVEGNPSRVITEPRTKAEVLHAETNALAKIARSTNSSEGASLFVTHAPCIHCAKLIHQSGINSVYYRSTYRTEDGIKFLRQCGVKVEQV